MAGKRKRREPTPATPPEIWSAILERLDARSLANARLVCREWRALATPLVRPARVREFLIEPIATLRGYRDQVPIGTLRNYRDQVLSIAPWAGLFVTMHAGGVIRLWSSSGALIFVLDCLARAAFGWGDTLVTVSIGPSCDAIGLWKISRDAGPTLRSGRRVGRVERYRILKNRVDYSFFGSGLDVVIVPWGDRLVVGRPDGDIETWDEKGAVLSRMVGDGSQIWCAVALGERLATASRSPLVRIWNKAGACVSILERGERVPEGAVYPGASMLFNMLAWGERLAVSYADGLVRAWTDPTEYSDLIAPNQRGEMYAWGGMLVTRGSASVAYVWDEFGSKSERLLSVDHFSYSTHGLLATRDVDAIRVWGVPE